MTPEQMKIDAAEAIHSGTNITYVRHRSTKPPSKFPRGKLLCENFDGTCVYSYDPVRVLAWFIENEQ